MCRMMMAACHLGQSPWPKPSMASTPLTTATRKTQVTNTASDQSPCTTCCPASEYVLTLLSDVCAISRISCSLLCMLFEYTQSCFFFLKFCLGMKYTATAYSSSPAHLYCTVLVCGALSLAVVGLLCWRAPAICESPAGSTVQDAESTDV
jgi:hypothetical protein